MGRSLLASTALHAAAAVIVAILSWRGAAVLTPTQREAVLWTRN